MFKINNNFPNISFHFWSYLSSTIVIFNNIILIPVILLFMNTNEIGLWYIFLSLSSFATLLNNSFSPTFSRNLTYSISGVNDIKKVGFISLINSEPNYMLSNNIIVASKRFHKLLSFFVFLVFITFGSLYVFSISSLSFYLKLFSWLLFILSVSLNIFFGYFISVLRGLLLITELNKSIIISSVLYFISAFILLFLNFGLFGLSLSYFLKTITYVIFLSYYLNRNELYRSNLKIKGNFIDASEVNKIIKVLLPNSIKELIISITGFLTSQSVILIMPFFLSFDQISFYSIINQVLSGISSISSTFYNSSQPKFQNLIIKKQQNDIRILFSISISTFILFFILGSLLFMLFIYFLNFFFFSIIFDYTLFTSFAVYSFLLSFHSINCSFLSNMNEIPYLKSFVFSSVSGFVLTFIFLSINSSLWAVFIGLASVQLIFNNWYWPMKVFKLNNLTFSKIFSISLESIFKVA